MKKISYTNNMPYIYSPDRKGAKYSMDGGQTYKNHGEFCESVAKFHRGLEYLVNPTTAWNEGDDIENLQASVKSGKCTLAPIYGNDFDTIINQYFNEVPSKLWIYVTDIDNTISEYHMNAEEFKSFLKVFGRLGKESGTHLTKVRILETSAKMLTWLDERCA